MEPAGFKNLLFSTARGPRPRRRPMKALTVVGIAVLFLVPTALWVPGVDAQAANSVSPTSTVPGDTEDYTFVFNSDQFPADSLLKVTFPSGDGETYGFSGATWTLKGRSAFTGNEQTEQGTVPSTSSNTIEVRRPSTATDGWTGDIELKIQGIKNPLWAGSGAPQIQHSHSCLATSCTTEDPYTFPPITFSAAPLEDTSVQTQFPVVGRSSPHTISFETDRPLDSTYGVRVTFPRDYELAEDPPNVIDQVGFCAGASPLVSKGEITINGADFETVTLTKNQNCATPSGFRDVTFRLGGLSNPNRAVPSDGFIVELVNPGGTAYARGIAAGINLQPKYDQFTTADATPADSGAGAPSDHTLTFTTTRSWPEGGSLVLYFPRTTAGVRPFLNQIDSATIVNAPSLCQDGFGDVSTISGTSANVVIIPRDPAKAACDPGTFEIKVGPIKNPGFPGTYASSATSYSFAIQDETGLDLQGSDPMSISIVPGVPISFNPTIPGSPKVTDSISFQLIFKLRNDWPADGKATIDFPPGYSVSQPTAAWLGTPPTCGGTFSATPNGLQVTISRTGPSRSACSENVELKISVGGVILPAKAGKTGPIVLSFFAGDGTLIERSHPTVPAKAVAPRDGSLSPPSPPDNLIEATALSAGSTTSYTFRVGGLGSQAVPWDATDLFAIGFPDGYDLSSVASTVNVKGPCTSEEGMDLPVKEIVDRTIVLERPQGAQACEEAGFHTFLVPNVKNPPIPGQASLYFATRTSNGVDERALGNGYVSNPFVTIEQPELTGAKIQLTNGLVGAATQFVVSFTSPLTIPADAKFSVTIPDDFTISNPAVVGTFTGCDGTLGSSWPALYVVDLERSGGQDCTTSGVKSFKISGGTNPTTAMTTGPFGLNIFSGSGDPLGENLTISGVKISPTKGALGAPAVGALSSLDYAGAKSAGYVFSFFSTQGVADNGKVRIVVPPGFDLSDASLGTVSLTDGSTCALAVDTITGSINDGWIVRVENTGSACSATTYSLILEDLDNPKVAGTYGPFRMFTEKAGLDQEASEPLSIAVKPGSLGVDDDLSILVQNPKVLEETSYTFGFNSVNAWPADGQIVIRFPEGYDLSGVPDEPMPPMLNCPSGFDEPVTVSEDGRTLTLVRDGAGGSCSGTGPNDDVGVKVPGVINPGATTPGEFDIELLDADGGLLSAAQGVVGPPLAPIGSTLDDLTIELQDYAAGATTRMWANFTSFSDWPADGKLVVRAPSGFGVAGVQLGGLGACDGAYSRSVSAADRLITISRTATGTTCTTRSISLELTGLVNPAVSGTTGPFSVMLRDAAGGDLDASHVPTVDILPGALTVDSVTAGTLKAGEFTTYTFVIGTDNEWPRDGNLWIRFEPGYGLNDVLSAPTAPRLKIGLSEFQLIPSTSMADGAPVLILARQNNGPTTFAQGSVIIEGVKNTPSAGPTDPFVIRTRTSSDAIIDEHVGTVLNIAPAGHVVPAPTVETTNDVATETGTYTITFEPRSDIPKAGCFRVFFPSGFGLDAATVEGGSVTVGGTAVPVTRETGLPGIWLARDPAGAPLSAATVQIVLDGIVNPPYASEAFGPISAFTRTSSTEDEANCAGADLDRAPGATIAIKPRTFTGTIGLTDNRAGEMADYTFSLTGTPNWRTTDSLIIRVPGAFDVSGVLASVSTTDAGAGTLSASVDPTAGTITVTRAADGDWVTDPSTAKTFRIFDLKNPAASGTGYVFDIELRDDQARLISAAEATVSEIVPLAGALSNLAADVADARVGSLTPYTIEFTTVTEWPENAGLRLRLPEGFDLDALVMEVSASPAGVGTLTAVANGDRDILISRDGPAVTGPQAVSLTLEGVRNPAISGSPGEILVATRDPQGVDLDVGSVQAPAILGDPVGVTVSAAGRLAGATDTYTFTVTPDEIWQGGGSLVVDFPAGHGLAGTSVASFTGCQDTFQSPPTVSGTTLTLTRSNAAACGESFTFAVGGVANPLVSGAPGPFILQLRDVDDHVIAVSDPIVGPAIQPFRSFLAEVDVQPEDDASSVAGKTGAVYVIGFRTSSTTADSIPADGFVSIRFPTGFGVSTATLDASSMDSCTTLSSASSSVGEVRFKLTTQCAGGTLHTLTIESVTNPAHAGSHGPVIVAVQDASGRDLESGSDAVTIDPAGILLQAPVRDDGSASAGEPATYLLKFTPTNPLPADGRVHVTAPEGFDLSGAAVQLWQGCAPLQIAEAAAGLLQLQFGGEAGDASCEAGTLKTLTLSNVRNTGRSGPTEPWFVETRTADGTLIDRSNGASGPEVTMRGGGLSGIVLTPRDPLVGATTDIDVAFTTSTTWPGGGLFEIGVPDGFAWDDPTAAFTGAGACTGGLIAEATGPVLVLTRDSQVTCVGGPRTIRVSGLVNADDAGPSGPFRVATQTPEGYDIDASATSTATIVGAMTSAVVEPEKLAAGATSEYAIQFHSTVAWPQNGFLVIAFPDGTGLAAAAIESSSVCSEASVGLSKPAWLPPNAVAVKLLDSGCDADDRTVTLEGIVNPFTSGATPVRLSLTGPVADGHAPILTGAIVPVAYEAVSLTSPKLEVTSTAAEQVSDYTFKFSSPVPLVPGSAVEFVFPTGYGFSGTLAVAGGAASDRDFVTTVETGSVRAALVGTSAWPAGSRVLTLSGVTNPEDEGPVGTVALRYVDAGGIPFAAGTFTGPTLGPPGDTTPPGAPGAFTTTSTLKEAPAWSAGRTHSVAWATDDVGEPVSGYSWHIDEDPDRKADTTTATASVTFPADGTHEFRLRAIDKAGNAGPIRTYAVQIDSVVPVLEPVTADRGVTSCTSEATATLTWPAATDAGSGLHPTAPYRVTVGSTTAAPTSETTATVNLVGGVNNVTVKAQDAAGNTASRTLDIKRDAAPPTTNLTAPSVAKAAFQISWQGTDDCSGVDTYRVESRLGQNAVYTALYEGTATSKLVPAPEEDGTIYLRMRATDELGNAGVLASQTPVTVIFDSTPPVAPGNLDAKAVGGGVIALAWQAATDGGSGLAGYHVYRAEGPTGSFSKVTTSPVSGVTYQDSASGKQHGKEYRYVVAAVDQAGNEGPQSPADQALADTRAVILSTTSVLSSLEDALGLSGLTLPVKALDVDGDGRYEGFEDPSGLISLEAATGIEKQQALLLRGQDPDVLALWVPSTGDVHPVEPRTGTIVDESRQGSLTMVNVTVDKPAGWILIRADDRRPGDDIVRVVAGDGRTIPLEQVFRSDGVIRVLDDPTTTYSIVYEAGAGTTADEGGFFGSLMDSASFVIGAVGAGIALLLVASIVAVTLVRRRRYQQSDDSPYMGGPAAMDDEYGGPSESERAGSWSSQGSRPDPIIGGAAVGWSLGAGEDDDPGSYSQGEEDVAFASEPGGPAYTWDAEQVDAPQATMAGAPDGPPEIVDAVIEEEGDWAPPDEEAFAHPVVTIDGGGSSLVGQFLDDVPPPTRTGPEEMPKASKTPTTRKRSAGGNKKRPAAKSKGAASRKKKTTKKTTAGKGKRSTASKGKRASASKGKRASSSKGKGKSSAGSRGRGRGGGGSR